MDTTYPLSIGAHSDGSCGLNGRIDELVLYKRVLSSSERSWLYNNGQTRSYAEVQPVPSSSALNYVYSYQVTGCVGGSRTLPHAVSTVGNNTYTYDCNGNQTTRTVNGQAYTLGYDAENRLVSVSGPVTASFVYDGDGRRVKSTVNGTSTYFIGAHYEVTGSQITKYYFAGSQRVAMRKYTIPQPMTVEYFLGDHLGSTSITTDNTGAKVSEMRYKPWGEVRYAWTAGTATTPVYKLPNYTFTGQYSYMDDPTTTGVTEGFGLMFYNARWYDPALGRFAQADTIVPRNAHGYDRFNCVSNRPTINTDPTGHMEWSEKEGTRPKPPCAQKPTAPAKALMDMTPGTTRTSMDTYVVAQFGVQNPNGLLRVGAPLWGAKLKNIIMDGNHKYASEGIAKVTDAEMETDYGLPINGGNNGYGLGLPSLDQNTEAGAYTAMSTRIQLRLDMCDSDNSCNVTNAFFAATFGGDNGVAPMDVQNLRNGINLYGKPDPTTGIFRWGEYLDKADNKTHNLKVLQQMVNNVAYLQDRGAAVPNVNWTYVCGLLEK